MWRWLLLLIAIPVMAQDQIFIGSANVGNITYNWDYNVDTTIINNNGTFIDNVLVNGTLTDSVAPGSTSLQVNDLYQHSLTDPVMLSEWGLLNPSQCNTNPLNCSFAYELVSDPQGTQLLFDNGPWPTNQSYSDPPSSVTTVTTPEPSTWIMVGCSLVGILLWKVKS